MQRVEKIFLGTLLVCLVCCALLLYWTSSNPFQETFDGSIDGAEHLKSSKRSRDVSPVERSPNEDNCWDEEQLLRKARVRRACQSFGEEALTRARGKEEQLLEFARNLKNLRFFYVNEEHKFIFCVVAKLGSTLWKKTLIVLQDPRNRTVDEITSKMAHYRHNLTQFNAHYTPEEISFRLNTYTKFVTMRNPLERLLSAFLSKFTEEGVPWVQHVYNKNYGHEWISVLRNKTNMNEPLKFEEMLKILSRRGLPTTTFNRHWMPIHDMCHPCLIEYDFIANFTALEHDGNQILDRLLKGSSKEGLRFPVVKNSTTGDRLKTLLQTLDPELVKDVQKTFHKDYEMFGYPIL